MTWRQCNNGARILQSRGAPGVTETSQSLWLLVPVLEAGQQGWESRWGRALIGCRRICNLWALCNLLIYLFTVFFSIFALNNAWNIFLNDKNVRNIYFLIWLYYNQRVAIFLTFALGRASDSFSICTFCSLWGKLTFTVTLQFSRHHPRCFTSIVYYSSNSPIRYSPTFYTNQLILESWSNSRSQ